MFTDTISLLIKEKSIQNYVIIESDAPELEEITVSLWLKTTQNDDEAFFITYAAGKPRSTQNAFAIFTKKSQLMLTIANNPNQANRYENMHFPATNVRKSNLRNGSWFNIL